MVDTTIKTKGNQEIPIKPKWCLHFLIDENQQNYNILQSGNRPGKYQ